MPARTGLSARSTPGRSSAHTATRRRPLGRAALALVAAIGVACAATVPSALAADGAGKRVYEMVSPIEKSGAQAGVGNTGTPFYSRVGVDGDHIIYSTTGPMGDAKRGVQFYTSGTRTATGWTAKATVPGPEPGLAASFVNHTPNAVKLSGDGQHIALSTNEPLVHANPAPFDFQNRGCGSVGLYQTGAEDAIQWLTQPQSDEYEPRPGQLACTVPGSVDGGNASYVAGGSTDLSTTYFAYCGQLTAADAPRAGRDGYGFYVAKDGVVWTAGTLPDGTVDPDGAQWAGLQGACNSLQQSVDPSALGHPVSEDGSRALFVSPDPKTGSSRPTQLYLHRQGQASVLVSRSELTGDPAPTGAQLMGTGYVMATPSGSRVVFRSNDRLTEDAPAPNGKGRFYRFDLATGDLVYLGGLPQSNDYVGTPIGISDDGANVLVWSQDGTDGPFVLSIWADGQVVPVGTLNGGNAPSDLHAHVSTDGKTFVFQTRAPFVDGASTHAPGTFQIYRYVLGQTGLPTCISCVPDGQTSAGDARLSEWGGPMLGTTPNSGMILDDARNVSPDGRRVYFDSPDPLVPSDTNGKRDVYEWADGELSLISTGQSDRDSFLLDTSVSTDDVFFATMEGLDPADRDDTYDVYDARVGGGFAGRAVVPCVGDACQLPPSAPWAAPVAASVTFAGQGNVPPVPGPPAPGSVSVSKVKSTTGMAASVKVKVSAPGSIRLSGAGLRTSTRKASKAGTYTVKASLTAKAKATLKKKRSLKVKVTVAFTPKGGVRVAKGVSLTFKQPKAKKRVAAAKRGRS